jgi:hypothetical protein
MEKFIETGSDSERSIMIESMRRKGLSEDFIQEILDERNKQ